MAQIDNIVTVNITRGTTAIDVRSFSIPLLLVAAGEYTGARVTTHTSVDSVAGMFTENHSAYRMAQALLSGDTKPSSFKVAVVWGEREVEGETVPAETYAEAFVAAMQEDDEAYALVADSKQDGDILALAKEVQARDMIYFSSTSNPESLNPNEETSVGYLLKESGFDQTALLYSEVAETAHPEVVWVGGNIAKTVGSLTWEYKKLPTVPVSSKLSDSDIHTLQQKNINYYIRVKGANITRRGKMTEGAWIDEVQIVHWLKARIQERVFFRLINNDKIPLKLAA